MVRVSTGEASPALHVDLPRWTGRGRGDGERSRELEPREQAALLQRVCAAFGTAGAGSIVRGERARAANLVG